MERIEIKLPHAKNRFRAALRGLASATIHRENRLLIITIIIGGVTIVFKLPP